MTSNTTLALRYAADLAAAIDADEALLHRLVDEFGIAIDIAAVVLRGEALRVYRRTGQAAGVVFDAGADARPVQTFRGQAVPGSVTNGGLRLHSTPLAWLRASCEGLLVFDYDRIDAVWQCPELVVDNIEHRDQVAEARERWIARTVPAVTIRTIWERDVGRGSALAREGMR